MISISKYQFNRHDLVRLKPNSKPLSEHSESDLLFFQIWIEQQFPFIITRQLGNISKIIKLGLPYFDAETNTKLRYSFSIQKRDVKNIKSLPNFVDVFPQINLNSNLSISVYGSYAWQYITGVQYVTDTSDLDVFIDYKDEPSSDISSCIHQLRQLFPDINIDGEIRLNAFGDCQIQEFLNPDASELLFKTSHDVLLIKRDTINAQYPKLEIK